MSRTINPGPNGLSPRALKIRANLVAAFRQAAQGIERSESDEDLRETLEFLKEDFLRTLVEDLRVALRPLDGVEDRMSRALERLQKVRTR